MTQLEWHKDKWSSHETWVAGALVGDKRIVYRVYDWKGDWAVTGLMNKHLSWTPTDVPAGQLACQEDLDVRERLQRWTDYVMTHEPPEGKL